MINKIFISFLQNAPEDLKTLLWLLLGGASGVIGYLYVSKERQREKHEEKLDKLQSDFSNYKDKTVEERVELIEKVLIGMKSYEKAFEEVPQKIVSKSFANCQKNLQNLIDKERRNGRTE